LWTAAEETGKLDGLMKELSDEKMLLSQQLPEQKLSCGNVNSGCEMPVIEFEECNYTVFMHVVFMYICPFFA